MTEIKCGACLHKNVQELLLFSKVDAVYERFVFVRYTESGKA